MRNGSLLNVQLSLSITHLLHYAPTKIASAGIKRWFGNGFKSQQEVKVEEDEMFEQYNDKLRIRGRRSLEKPTTKEKS